MILYDNDKNMFEVSACKKPKMSNNSRGATWDSIYKTIDTVKIQFHLETSWGQYMYFMYNGIWYKMSLFCDCSDTYEIKEFFTNEDLRIDNDKFTTTSHNVRFYNTLYAWNWECYYTKDEEKSISDIWESIVRENKNSLLKVDIIGTFNEFKSIISNPSTVEIKIIKNLPIWRKEEILR